MSWLRRRAEVALARHDGQAAERLAAQVNRDLSGCAFPTFPPHGCDEEHKSDKPPDLKPLA